MDKLKKYTPDGMRDILFKECEEKLYVEKKLRNLYKLNGFSEIISPTLEFYDVFNFENQPIAQEKMYKLFDRNGRILVLKPDMTMPIGRIVATKVNYKDYPLKLCYTSNIFRINENLNGKTSEITQSGIEIIGIENIKADAEVVITAIESLLQLGLKNFKIELGQSKFFKEIIKNENINKEEVFTLKNLIENKNYVALKDYLKEKTKIIKADTIKILEQLPRMFGDIGVVYEAKNLVNDNEQLKALDEILSLYKIIDKVGLSKYVSIDLGMIQDIDYYTGVIFKGYVEGVGDYILSGGRYDKLIGNFGCDLPSTGFGINIDNIIEALRIYEVLNIRKFRNVILHCENKYLNRAYKIANRVRKNNIICEISLRDTIEDTIKYARSKCVDKIIFIDNREFIKIYDINFNKSKEVIIDNFLEELI
ncbi:MULTISPECIES: ATP phosphoribosyltransferase regulatory subunit [Clostridium]|uniref:ATP phosphoribosyltransferase regulatory subunit n=1 Tax=Clostridium novyi (strain NT) TaxID=386415 RepID=HISZ_CLONN|nr:MULTISPECIES: ATP phosphoribosyltransferase regulatory subunit [Clostridium]A0PXP2.1 RecName: Full=ATP phosphoribosyltransferase regulatory subunit [Clostridium novyi NT]ABK61372.1 histidyl-tRNA synthetase [Clostridium novyi NT]KEH84916.1 ATP phosphoribosyltransferase [Clostridium novyi A str. NCTC 538]KEH85124.1 ATP phosphoribosyltransferase [Clostridium novyi A str. 4540]KEH85517.1 ATP phosphoribosyltransferase [Clostridium novyi A str. BKT29909]KEH91511.1 ATP phosphoribosyltransferase [